MSIFEHSRFAIYSAAQHPYKHSIDDFLYANNALPTGLTSLQSALDYLFAVLYPKSQPAVATPGDLPLVGNDINDMRVVTDDGDGKAASYRWEQREGEASASWHKIYDVDWGTDSILQSWHIKTQDVYVSKYGYDDIDENGDLLTGDLAGQYIYGGATAGSHLTLYANSGDGVGPATGYVQFGDSVRPLNDSLLTIGTHTYRWIAGYFDSVYAGSLVASSALITDTTGQISFDNENLLTTGWVNCRHVVATVGASIFASTTQVGTLTLSDGTITDSTGAITFDNENLSTTGTLTVGTSLFSGATWTNTTGTISFDDENLTTTGNITGAVLTATTRVDVDSIRLDGQTVSITAVDQNLILQGNGTGQVYVDDTLYVNGAATVNGAFDAVGTVSTGLLRMNHADATLLALATNDLILSTTDAGAKVFVSRDFLPSVTGQDLGDGTHQFGDLFLQNSITNSTYTMLVGDLFALRSTVYRDFARTQAAQAGDALFYDAVNGVWLASVPDTEITHSGLFGLTTGDAGHTQFAMLAGRAGGQTLQGGVAASENLVLESTAHATKGDVLVKDDFLAFTDASYAAGWQGTDIGGSGNRFRHLYTAGEHFGLRLENLAVDPASSSQRTGRLWFNSVTLAVMLDDGLVVKEVGGSRRYQEDMAWNGSETTKTTTVTTLNMDARRALWQLTDNTNNYERIYCRIECLSDTSVRVTVGTPLAAGTYRLIGIE